jgi:tetratricopeptide (TPR) repeat protein
MTLSRILPIALLAAGAAAAQTAPPAPPATPAPPPAAAAPAAPAMAPTPPLPPDVDLNFDDRMFELRNNMQNLRDNFHLDMNLDFDVQAQVEMARDNAQMARDQAEMARDAMRDMGMNFPMFAQATPRPGAAPTPAMPGMPPMPAMRVIRYNSVDRAYEAGQRSLEARRYGDALEAFNQVVAHGGNRADGALYWKAYALIKLGRADEARAAIAELRKSYASSRWLDDAKVLEVDAGKPVTPESESDEDLKLIALNGLMQSDPDRALPLIDGLLKSSQPPTIKRKALFVLAQSNTPKGQQVLEQVARGQGNPDLQVAAIRYLGDRRRQGATGANPVLAEIYGSSTDPNVKRAILNAYESARDKDHLLQIAKTEHDADMRLSAIRLLGSMQTARDDLWSLYGTDSSADVRQQILEALPSTGNYDKFLEAAKSDREPKLRRLAVQNLASTRAAATGDGLAALYASEQDASVKRAIVDALGSQKNVKAMVQIARSEKDTRMQQQILERLVSMKSPEANDYLMEIIKK